MVVGVIKQLKEEIEELERLKSSVEKQLDDSQKRGSMEINNGHSGGIYLWKGSFGWEEAVDFLEGLAKKCDKEISTRQTLVNGLEEE